MFPFWEVVIAPALDAIGAKRVVEIGALRGETTVLMLEHLGPDAEVHVIDPAPAFDPTEHQEKFAGRYTLHRDISHNVLPHLPAMDAALVDGDHNWYTVYNELKMLATTARDAGAALPLLIMHDVCWPYGRRDLYYAPERIPAEFRKKYAQRGMKRDKPGLVLAGGGLNYTMYNATREGGSRNGVMTALDDFVAEHDRPLRRVVLPVYFGLALVADEERLERSPELARLFDRLEVEGESRELLELAEEIRLQAMVYQHSTESQHEQKIARAAERYVDLLKGALLDEQYLENELRIDYLTRCVERGTPVDPAILRDPTRRQHEARRRLETGLRAGTADDATGYVVRHDGARPSRPPAALPRDDRPRDRRGRPGRVRDRTRRGRDLPAWLPGGARAAWPPGLGRRHVPRPFGRRRRLDHRRVRRPEQRARSVRALRAARRPGPLPAGSARVTPCPTPRSTGSRCCGSATTSTVRWATRSTRCTTRSRWVASSSWTGSRRRRWRGAIEDFRGRRRITEPLERVDGAAVYWQKVEPATRSGSAERVRPVSLARTVFPTATRSTHRDLSVVVAVYNMRREAERTLQSLSRAYQRGIDDLDYEVIVLENGSDQDQKLGDDFVRGFGPEFRYVDLEGEATPSPVHALNRGVALASGDALALMIDGAHVLTPGVLRYGMAGLATYAPAIVATQQWYVGPGQQGEVERLGYDRDFEDRLFTEIEWPVDGYRLFDVGHFIGDRDWFDGIWESNCVFVPRRTLEQVGAFDEAFSVPGGGYANLELFERLASTPGITLATIMGEGSFHQVHGGTTTNVADADERRRRLVSYAQQYAEIRGRPFRGPNGMLHFVGSMPPRAARTKPRRRAIPNRFKAGLPDPEGLSPHAVPIPDDLKAEFVEAFWHSHAWQDTTWLGRPLARPATDLMAYQELISRLRPEWIVETGTGDGGRALFLASICELLGAGHVLSIDEDPADDLPRHPRITYLAGHPTHAGTAQRVREHVGDPPNALVVLGSRGNRQRMMAEFTLYAPLVPLGSYVVMEETIVNGHPVWPSFGPGPFEAARQSLAARDDFVPDLDLERAGLTFNPQGFLKRVK